MSRWVRRAQTCQATPKAIGHDVTVSTACLTKFEGNDFQFRNAKGSLTVFDQLTSARELMNTIQRKGGQSVGVSNRGSDYPDHY